MTYKGAPLMSVDQTWGTPQSFLTYLEDAFGFVPDLDAAASVHNAKAGQYYTEEQNSLTKNWFGNVWLNPPFGKVMLPAFLEKCRDEIAYGNCERIFVLIPARTDTKWFHEIVMPEADIIYLIKGRFNFVSPNACESANAPFPSMLVTYNQYKPPRPAIISTLELSAKVRGF